MFSGEIPLVPRGMNFELFANLVAEERSKCCYCFQISNRPIFWNRPRNLLNIKIDLPQIEGCFESCTVLKSLEVLGMRILFHIVVCPGHLLDYLTAFAQTKERK